MDVETDARSRRARTLNHLLKVFLIHSQLWVREVYGVPTLDVAALVNDLKTVAGEAS